MLKKVVEEDFQSRSKDNTLSVCEPTCHDVVILKSRTNHIRCDFKLLRCQGGASPTCEEATVLYSP
jgi:hypothetical protein